MSRNFDSLKMKRRLEQIGFTDEQATGLAYVVSTILDDREGRPQRIFQEWMHCPLVPKAASPRSRPTC
jgi:hypothetical protein